MSLFDSRNNFVKIKNSENKIKSITRYPSRYPSSTHVFLENDDTRSKGAEEVELEERCTSLCAHATHAYDNVHEIRTGRSQLAYQSVPGTSRPFRALLRNADWTWWLTLVDTGSGCKGKWLCKRVIGHDMRRGWRPIFIYSRTSSFVSRSIFLFSYRTVRSGDTIERKTCGNTRWSLFVEKNFKKSISSLVLYAFSLRTFLIRTIAQK